LGQISKRKHKSHSDKKSLYKKLKQKQTEYTYITTKQ